VKMEAFGQVAFIKKEKDKEKISPFFALEKGESPSSS